MSKLFFEIVGDVTFEIQIAETHDSALFFEVTAKGAKGAIAALNTLEFGLSSVADLGSVFVESPMIAAKVHTKDEDGQLDGPFDIGIAFDADGMADLASDSICFMLRHKTDALKVDAVYEQSFGVRTNANAIPEPQSHPDLVEETVFMKAADLWGKTSKTVSSFAA